MASWRGKAGFQRPEGERASPTGFGRRATNRAESGPAGGGSIINIASRSGHVGVPAAAAYAASKAAVLNQTRSVALYCGERDLGIRCNAISPAAILTPMWEPMLGDGPDRETRMAEFIADTPLRRFGEPAEVAALAVLIVRPVSKDTEQLSGRLHHFKTRRYAGFFFMDA